MAVKPDLLGLPFRCGSNCNWRIKSDAHDGAPFAVIVGDDRRIELQDIQGIAVQIVPVVEAIFYDFLHDEIAVGALYSHDLVEGKILG